MRELFDRVGDGERETALVSPYLCHRLRTLDEAVRDRERRRRAAEGHADPPAVSASES